jgi:hypothetical protein
MKTRIKNRSAFGDQGKDLLDFARTYLSNAFPNPDREGCPPDAALQSLTFNPKESQPAVTAHLAACSPCFRRYAELLTDLKSRRDAEGGVSWRHLSRWPKAHPVPAWTALACALFIAIGFGLLLRRIRQPNTSPIDTNQRPSPTEPVPSTVAYSPFSLDLSALSHERGSEQSTTEVQGRAAVPSSPLDLTLTLPLASPEGSYDLKLTSGGRAFWSKSAQARLQEGKTLVQIEADFRQIPTGNYDLEVQTSTGIRLVQPVSIQAALPKSGEHNP